MNEHLLSTYDVLGSVSGIRPGPWAPPCRTAIHLGGVHESPSIEQAESMLVAVAEAGLIGDPVRAVVLVLTAQGSW